MKKHVQRVSIDGVWNLVLACSTCNKGVQGKFARLPSLALLYRLNTRNEYLIESYHPLRETLMQQTGETAGERQRFLTPGLMASLMARRIGLECMDNQAACRTYNILMAEGRKVALALIMQRTEPQT